ncbi:MAG: 2-amino-4-hydroxy-6-hydroxymethyldihydropteridine diphosphokinase [Muribaculaceae bacterium]|nr:2-amino-4-hydroxy-6-hydroxymethyldihydropteridine diphosphokinase [Muribaculaceae bacterium]
MRYYFNIGTNLGCRHQNVGRAIAALCARGTRCRVSDEMESEPWGFQSSNRFLNVGVAVDLDLSPQEVLDWVHGIELRLGSAGHRDENGGYIDRLVDIDIMAIDDNQGRVVTIDMPNLQVPHRHLYDRPFFIIPYRQLKEMTEK